jgi:hypothetical protein
LARALDGNAVSMRTVLALYLLIIVAGILAAIVTSVINA